MACSNNQKNPLELLHQEYCVLEIAMGQTTSMQM